MTIAPFVGHQMLSAAIGDVDAVTLVAAADVVEDEDPEVVVDADEVEDDGFDATVDVAAGVLAAADVVVAVVVVPLLLLIVFVTGVEAVEVDTVGLEVATDDVAGVVEAVTDTEVTGVDVAALPVVAVVGEDVAATVVVEREEVPELSLDAVGAALLVFVVFEAAVEVAAVLLLVVGDSVGAIGAAGLST